MRKPTRRKASGTAVEENQLPPPPPESVNGGGGNDERIPPSAGQTFAYDLVVAGIANTLLMTPIWAGRDTPNGGEDSLLMLQKLVISMMFSLVKVDRILDVLNVFFSETMVLARQRQQLYGEVEGNA